MLIDALILTGANLLLAVSVPLATQSDYADISGFLQLTGLVGGWLYYAVLESSERQATFGKRRMGIRVTDVLGQRISFGRATARWFGRWLSTIILGVGFLFIFWTKRRQTLHDLMAGCVIVRVGAVSTSAPIKSEVGSVAASPVSAVAVTLFCLALLAAVSGLAVWSSTKAPTGVASVPSEPQSNDHKRWLAESRTAETPASTPAPARAGAGSFDGPTATTQRLEEERTQTDGGPRNADAATSATFDVEQWFAERRAEKKRVIGQLNRVQPLVSFAFSSDFSDSDGVIERRLETEAGRYLMAAGITLLEGREPPQPRDAQLHVEITRRHSGADTSLLVEAHVSLPARLVTHPEFERHMEVWRSSKYTVTCPPSEVDARLPYLIGQATHEFAKEWLLARRD